MEPPAPSSVESSSAAPLAASPSPSIDMSSDDAAPSAAGAAGIIAHKARFRVSAVISLSAALVLLALLLASLFAVFFLRHRGRRRKSRLKHRPPQPQPPPPLLTVVAVESASSSHSPPAEKGLFSCSSSSLATTISSDARGMGWGRWYTLEELETATGGFDAKNVIGEGGYGTVYRGVFADGGVVAVKNLFDNKGQADKEFKVEVEAIGRVRHKNLVGLVGYCSEGSKRMLVYEYVENGNLEQWLHGDVGRINPLTWDARMKIAIGTAKGIAYLHEGLEPKVVHRDIKSSNILLDKQWNPKVSDFGMAKLLGPGSSYVTTRVMGTFGYVAPEYASTGMLNESSDIYSFGVLLMELISGRSPVDYNRPAGEVNLVDWFKAMVGSRKMEELIDPSIEVPPPPRTLNRVVLVSFRCIDSDAQKRPSMGQIVHMLEGDEFPYRLEHRSQQYPRTAVGSTTRVALLPETVGPSDSERSMCR